MVDLNELSAKCYELSKKNKSHKDLLKSDSLKDCIGAVMDSAMARTAFEDCSDDLKKYNFPKEVFACEMMNIIIYVLIECKEYQINVEDMLLKCIKGKRY